MGLAGGVETMSKNPMAWEGGINPAIEASKQAQSCLMPMGITSENVAARFGVDRCVEISRSFLGASLTEQHSSLAEQLLQDFATSV